MTELTAKCIKGIRGGYPVAWSKYGGRYITSWDECAPVTGRRGLVQGVADGGCAGEYQSHG